MAAWAWERCSTDAERLRGRIAYSGLRSLRKRDDLFFRSDALGWLGVVVGETGAGGREFGEGREAYGWYFVELIILAGWTILYIGDL